jgi:hypothetical protein
MAMKQPIGRRIFKFLALSVLAILVISYAPSWLYVAFLAGWMPQQKVQDVNVSLASGWYPVLTTESWLGRGLLKTTRPATVFFKVGWPKPWLGNEMTMIKLSDNEKSKLAEAKKMVTSSKDYSWGRVNFMDGVKVVYIERFSLSVSNARSFDELRSALDDVRDIKTIAVRAQ